MNPFYPKESRLPALERNILKYRALEMVMILFHAESLKEFVLKSIQATDRILTPRNPRIPAEAKEKYKKACAILVSDKILTQEECKVVQGLLDFRNHIGHRIHRLTCDISHDSNSQSFARHSNIKYDYDILNKLKYYRRKIEDGFSGKYAMSLSPDTLLFEAAQKTYERELRLLDHKIRRQLEARKKDNQKLKQELSEDSYRALDAFPYPFKYKNGKLTKSGIELCHHLFNQNKSPLAVAYLLRISYRAAIKRFRAWEQSIEPNTAKKNLAMSQLKPESQPRRREGR